MPRKKLSPANVAIFAGPSPATGVHTTSNIKELLGLQSFSYDMSETKEDIFVFGKRANIGREGLEPPVISFDLSYYLSNFDNEKSLGMVVNGVSGAFADILNGTKDERNIFVMMAGDGLDAVGASPATTPNLGLGNATLSSYNFNAAVGSYPTVSLTFEAIDAEYYDTSDSESPLPAIDITTGAPATGSFTLPTASGNTLGNRDAVLRPRDITVNASGLTGLFHNLATACVQSVDIGIDFGREKQLCLGSKYRVESSLGDTIPITVALEFLAKDMITGRLSNFSCLTGEYNMNITIKRPSCLGTGAATAAYLEVRGLSWESQSQDFTVGTNSTVTINFAGTVGGSNDFTKGLFISGIANT